MIDRGTAFRGREPGITGRKARASRGRRRMQAFFRDFFEAFIPLFVAIDPFGMVPIFLAVTAAMTPAQRRRVTFEAVGAATIIALSFMLLGHAIFRFLYITEDDFRIAGGILLLVLAIM